MNEFSITKKRNTQNIANAKNGNAHYYRINVICARAFVSDGISTKTKSRLIVWTSGVSPHFLWFFDKADIPESTSAHFHQFFMYKSIENIL
jgi:hypothetical protein